MTGYIDRLKLKGQADEDIYFARRDKELVEALRRRKAEDARKSRFPLRLVSGGQTGVDRGALDIARAMGYEVGGWCPRGRRAEDGPIDEGYPLRETPSRSYSQRTEWNVRDSDATLVLYREAMTGGTARTAQLARRYGRPLLAVDLAQKPDPEAVRGWLFEHSVRILNVAGPRESGAPGIRTEARAFLYRVLRLQSEPYPPGEHEKII